MKTGTGLVQDELAVRVTVPVRSGAGFEESAAAGDVRGIEHCRLPDEVWRLAASWCAGFIGVLAGPDGVLMVDSQFAPLTQKIVAAIKPINPGPFAS